MKTKILSLLVLCAVFGVGTVNAAAIYRYVTVTGAGSKDGSNWENAADGSTTANIQTQIDAVAANAAPLATDVRGEIRFGAGTYSLSATLTLKDGTSLIGGYPTIPVTSTNETRDLVNNQTIFDGGNARKLMNAPDASGIVYTHITLLDGLIIQRGNSSYGSAMAITYGFVLQNCILRNNTGSSGSGAAVRVIRNSFNTGGTNPSNTGGAFINCVFANNSTTKGASAIMLEGNAYSSIVNCVFANNVTTDNALTKVRNTNARGYFGTVHIGTASSSMRIVNNIFYNNSAFKDADKHLGSSYYVGYIYNNYFDGNQAWKDSVSVYYTKPGDVTFAYYKNFTTNNNKCNVDYAASTIFAAPNSILGSSSVAGDITTINSTDWRLKAGSPCINAGISTTTADISYPYSIMLGANRAYSTIASDLRGNSRVVGSNADMGAYEYNVATSGNTITISAGPEILASTLSLDGAKDVIVNNGGTLIIDGTTTAVNSLTINGGGKVTNNAGNTLTTGSFTINSDASNVIGTYLDNGTTSITGTATVNKYLTGAMGSGRANWYISSPVSGAMAAVFNVENAIAPINKLAKYNEVTPAYEMVTSNAESLNPCVGYVANIAGADAVYSFTTSTGDATAKLNNGLYSPAPTRTGTSAGKRGFNLVGNPYPSFLDWNAVTKTNVRSTIWYRTYTGSAMQFDTFDGYIGTSLGVNGQVSRYIPPMQAFWVRVDLDGSNGSLTFNNTMRSHQSQALNNRLRVRSVSNPQILRLKVSNGINADEAIVVTNSNASDGYDSFDSPKMTNANAQIPEIFTLADKEETVINYLSDVSANKQLALGFRTGAANTFSIKATEIDNFGGDIKIILKDNDLNTEQDLTDGSTYSFSSVVANTVSRFSILFKSTSISTGLNNNVAGNMKLNIFKNANNQITINRSGLIASEGLITICNALGQKLLNVPTTGVNTLINNLLCPGVYLVNLSVEGKNTTEKIIIN